MSNRVAKENRVRLGFSMLFGVLLSSFSRSLSVRFRPVDYAGYVRQFFSARYFLGVESYGI